MRTQQRWKWSAAFSETVRRTPFYSLSCLRFARATRPVWCPRPRQIRRPANKAPGKRGIPHGPRGAVPPFLLLYTFCARFFNIAAIVCYLHTTLWTTILLPVKCVSSGPPFAAFILFCHNIFARFICFSSADQRPAPSLQMRNDRTEAGAKTPRKI